MSPTKTILIPAILALALAGCANKPAHLGSDFGLAVNQNVVAQIADPDARYPQEVVSDGARAALAMERYRTGKTIPPIDLSASTIAVSSGGGASPK